ncbi:MAG: metalloregulator ArsR/SmtB family transcription factor [Parasphingorhabdus sp.]|uniref:ArsR/SmtB family transcription factor n=1 Tax=Parasphingorhabdus sp. TaxID=2709688 RepID=UPI003297F549
METIRSHTAVDALSALAQEHRLAIFRLLVQAGRSGLPAGQIAKKLDMPASSLSFHLSHLKNGGVVSDERDGRSIIYRADFQAMNQLMAFLLENCCEGDGCESADAADACMEGQDA